MKIEFTKKEEISEIIKLESEEENLKYILPNSKEAHLKLIEDVNCNHLIVKSTDQKILGFVILAGIKSTEKSVEFRRIVVAEKGKGLGRKIIKEIKKYCFEKLQMNRLWLDVLESNLRARTLYESEGFKVEGTLRESIFKNGQFENLIIMSMLHNEYESNVVKD